MLLRKHKENEDIEFPPVYFNSITKAVIALKYNLEKSFQEILYGIDIWIKEGYRWVIESVKAEYVNIFIYSSLSGSTYIELPRKLKNSVNGLINIESNDSKCFLWCHIRHLNLLKINPERITKADKSMLNDLNYEGIKFLVSKEDYSRTEPKNNISINVFCHENGLTCPFYASNKKFKDCMDLLVITDKNESHYVYFKDFNRFMCNKKKCKSKKHFCRYCLQCFSSEFWLNIKRFV